MLVPDFIQWEVMNFGVVLPIVKEHVLVSFGVRPEFPHADIISPFLFVLLHGDQVVGSFIECSLLSVQHQEPSARVLLQVEVVGRVQSVEASPVPLDSELEQSHLVRDGVHYQVPRLLPKHQLVHERVVALRVAHCHLERNRPVSQYVLLLLPLLFSRQGRILLLLLLHGLGSFPQFLLFLLAPLRLVSVLFALVLALLFVLTRRVAVLLLLPLRLLVLDLRSLLLPLASADDCGLGSLPGVHLPSVLQLLLVLLVVPLILPLVPLLLLAHLHLLHPLRLPLSLLLLHHDLLLDQLLFLGIDFAQGNLLVFQPLLLFLQLCLFLQVNLLLFLEQLFLLVQMFLHFLLLLVQQFLLLLLQPKLLLLNLF